MTNSYQLRRDVEHMIIGKNKLDSIVLACAITSLMDSVEHLQMQIERLEGEFKSLKERK